MDSETYKILMNSEAKMSKTHYTFMKFKKKHEKRLIHSFFFRFGAKKVLKTLNTREMLI